MRRDPLAESFREALDAEEAGPRDAAEADEALLARAIDRAMSASVAPVASLAPPPAVPAAPAAAGSTGSLRSIDGGRQARLRAFRYALPAAAALVTTVAMAAVYMSYRNPPPPVTEVTRTVPESVAAVTGPAAPPARLSAPPSESAPSISIEDLPSVAPRASGSARAEAARTNVPSSASAAELFRDANASRRAGEVDKAVELYGSLVTRHPDTPEALAARVSLGRLLLDRRGDGPGALVHFDAYLASAQSDGALAEEARLGRALVFQRQGRHLDERRAWHELLERHPDSLYAARARERLRALAPADLAPALSSPVP